MFSFFKKKNIKKEQLVVEIISGDRRTGRTTRIVDKLIQDFFNNGACYFYDHFGTSEAAINVHNIILSRLENEHRIKPHQIKVDFKNNIITYERNSKS